MMNFPERRPCSLSLRVMLFVLSTNLGRQMAPETSLLLLLTF